MKKFLAAAAAGALLAAVVAFAVTPGSWTHYRFLTGRFETAAEAEEVSLSLRKFSGSLAMLYMAGRPSDELNAIPADPLLKRRLVMDINELMEEGTILVPDRDISEVREISFLDPAHAVAVRDEDWYLAFQDAKTRRPLSTKKTNSITVRYFLKKQWGRWIVIDFDAFGREDTLPPVAKEKFVRW